MAEEIERICTPTYLPTSQLVDAARIAIDVNPMNSPMPELFASQLKDTDTSEFANEQYIAAMTTKFWRSGKVDLGVTFLETTPADLRAMILSHLNAWGAAAEVFFRPSSQGEVRISRARGGYWSYMGTDILSIPANQPTMNLEACTMQWPEAERRRVIRHEAGHTLGFPHDQQLPEIVAKLDVQKTIRYFAETQGWSKSETKAQVLTPINMALVTPGSAADTTSIMCYQLPAAITIDNVTIKGGNDINERDAAFAGKLYPKAAPPVEPPTPPVTGKIHVKQTMVMDGVTFETVEYDLKAK